MNNQRESLQTPDIELLATLGVPHRDSRQLYLAYLRTDVLSTLVEQLEGRIYAARRSRDRRRLELYQDMLEDAILELRGRQLELFSDPALEIPKPS